MYFLHVHLHVLESFSMLTCSLLLVNSETLTPLPIKEKISSSRQVVDVGVTEIFTPAAKLSTIRGNTLDGHVRGLCRTP